MTIISMYMLQFEIQTVDRCYSLTKHLIQKMEPKKIAIFSEKGRNNTEFKAELCDWEINFPNVT